MGNHGKMVMRNVTIILIVLTMILCGFGCGLFEPIPMETVESGTEAALTVISEDLTKESSSVSGEEESPSHTEEEKREVSKESISFTTFSAETTTEFASSSLEIIETTKASSDEQSSVMVTTKTESTVGETTTTEVPATSEPPTTAETPITDPGALGADADIANYLHYVGQDDYYPTTAPYSEDQIREAILSGIRQVMFVNETDANLDSYARSSAEYQASTNSCNHVYFNSNKDDNRLGMLVYAGEACGVYSSHIGLELFSGFGRDLVETQNTGLLSCSNIGVAAVFCPNNDASYYVLPGCSCGKTHKVFGTWHIVIVGTIPYQE